ncbi:glycoside hydrolase family 9 protein [Myxococcota bacterium]|nr:glycoside hydrolase family 9 protein [Myxococcota bacterium]
MRPFCSIVARFAACLLPTAGLVVACGDGGESAADSPDLPLGGRHQTADLRDLGPDRGAITVDAALDARVDLGQVATPDAGADASADVGPAPIPDASADAGPPPTPDASADAGPPPTPDAALACRFDAAVDAGVLVPPDLGIPGDLGPVGPDPEPDAAPVDLSPYPADPTGLIAYWPLDEDFRDAVGAFDAEAFLPDGFAANETARPAPNGAYGPTGRPAANNQRINGAVVADLTLADVGDAVTLEGWFFKSGGNASGTLFGFGEGRWDETSLSIGWAWNDITLEAGAFDGRRRLQLALEGSGCWHHLALTFERTPVGEAQVALFIDGVRHAPPADAPPFELPPESSPFVLGIFGGDPNGDAATAALDEVRLWGRVLTDDELADAARPRGPVPGCGGGPAPEPVVPAWSIPPRCRPQAAPTFRGDGEVRLLTDEWISVVTDPTPWLTDRYVADCGEKLAQMEATPNLETAMRNIWHTNALMETQVQWLPGVLAEWEAAPGWRMVDCNGVETPMLQDARFLHAKGEWSAPRPWSDRPPVVTTVAEHVMTNWLRLPRRLAPGETVGIRDPWGHTRTLTYGPETVSWAFKVNQVAMLPDAPTKRAWLGAWLGPAGPLDLDATDGEPFQVVDASTGEVVYEGVIREAAESLPELTGERLMVLDFSPVVTPGTYFLRVDGIGRSRRILLSEEAFTDTFVTYARGLYHNRCATLEEAHTAWPREDRHQVYQGGFATLDDSRDQDHYGDHSAEGWGVLEADGQWRCREFGQELCVPFHHVAATATDVPLPHVTGGWHDAGDWDRRSMHLSIVEDLAQAYLTTPERFPDGQLGLPESGNGLPDVLDEAVFGLQVWRAGQRDDGAVALWIEATGHPSDVEPWQHEQRFYLGLATHDSSLVYARSAALLSRALHLAGDAAAAEGWLESAARAYAFGVGEGNRVEYAFVDPRSRRDAIWRENPRTDRDAQFWALVELMLAAQEPDEAAPYAAELTALSAAGVFDIRPLFDRLDWRWRLGRLLSLVAHPDRFDPGWLVAARDTAIDAAAQFVHPDAPLPYDRAWRRPDADYFYLEGWGQGGFPPIRDLAVAWHITGDPAYRDAALRGLDYLHGANPLGRVLTTGLGEISAQRPLHWPSMVDANAEAIPGIPLYGPEACGPDADDRTCSFQGAAERLYRLVRNESDYYRAAALDVPLLPPSLAEHGRDEAAVHAYVRRAIPGWRRLSGLTQSDPPHMEFTVWETTGPAMMAHALLLPDGVAPTAASLERVPRSAEALRSASWPMP